MKPLVSVIIPSFNHAKYIENTIRSVLNQDYKNIEVIVVDDGSVDETPTVLKQFEGIKGITVVINSTNRGQSAVLNQALRIAQGSFIALLPSDDWYEPNKISLQIQKFNTLPDDYGVVYGRGLRYYEDTGETRNVDLPLYRGDVLEKFIRFGNFVYPVTPLFKRECFEFAVPDESYRAEGEAIYNKIALKYKFDYVDEVVATMRDHSYNTGKVRELMYFDNIRYWNEFFNREDIPAKIKALKYIPISKTHRIAGIEYVAIGRDMTKGRKALLNALAFNYRLLMDYRVMSCLFISLFPAAVANMLLNAHRERK